MAHPVRKRFGQHFLHDPNIIRKIISALNVQENEFLIEIGPGLGALTLPLLQQANYKKYLALEIDRDAIKTLKSQTADFNNFQIIESNALRADFKSLIPEEFSIKVFGNLPYNISTPLIFHLLEYKSRIREMVFMLQKEVVDRIVAEPGSKIYGRLSVMVQANCDTEKLFNVPPSAFTPPPKVDSAMISLLPNTSDFDIQDNKLFTNLVRDAFNQRRKTIRNSMRNYLTEQDFETLELDAKLRAENLAVHDFICISNYLSRNKQLYE